MGTKYEIVIHHERTDRYKCMCIQLRLDNEDKEEVGGISLSLVHGTPAFHAPDTDSSNRTAPPSAPTAKSNFEVGKLLSRTKTCKESRK